MDQLSQRLSRFPQSAISEMNVLAEQTHAINLASGFPDFDPPQAIIEAAIQALRQGYNQYAHPAGSFRLRQALAAKQARFSGLNLNAEEHITITCGGTEAMLTTLAAVINPGDRILVFSPFYENYAADIHLLDGIPVFIPLRPPHFQINQDELIQEVQKGVKALIVCNPANPSGKVFNEEELKFIADLAQEHGFYVITDEVYEHIVFEPHQHIYFSALPGMFDHCITIGSLSKTYAITGWRLGYIIANQKITQAVQKVHDYTTLGTAAPLQEAAIVGLNFPEMYYQNLRQEYTNLRDIFLSYLDQAGLKYIPPQGAYFVLVDISDLGFSDDWAFCRWLAKEIGVAAVPGSSFFHEPINHLVRFNFAKSPTTMHEAGARLLKIKEKI
ncbi:MAG: pyridoxal phosphate-dependent aminotransferase [Anaerolineales bacterium]